MPYDPLFLATAVEAALQAGEIQLAHFGAAAKSAVRIDKKGTIDLVTNVDLEVEDMLRKLIADRFPEHDVLAEERGRSSRGGGPQGRCCWVFDPLDGTVNYAHGLPIFCASASLEIDRRAVVGAVYDPTRKELFTAERSGGAFLNGTPIKVSGAAMLIDALLCTGFPYNVHSTVEEVVGLFGEFVGRAQAVRRLGSAALDLCYVAAGRLDGFWEQRLHAWDMSAGALIVEEGGGRVTAMDGRAFDAHGGEVVATNGLVHDEMVATVRAFMSRRSGNRTD